MSDPRNYLECPCCGGVGAIGRNDGAEDLYADGQELVCRCIGQVEIDDWDEPAVATINVDECTCQDEEQNGLGTR